MSRYYNQGGIFGGGRPHGGSGGRSRSSNGTGEGQGRRTGGFGRPTFSIKKLFHVEEDAVATAPDITLSPDQAQVFDAIMAWAEAPGGKRHLTFGGLAGTGKTTLVSKLAQALKETRSIAFGAYTGKAANVLSRKLKESGVKAPCSTLHSLMYEPIIHDHDDPDINCSNSAAKCPKNGRVEAWRRKAMLDASLIIVDEASMVGRELWDDLCSFDIPILAVGDHGQLPPIDKAAVNLMANPDLKLEKIHRQAEGNPILALAHHVRHGGNPRHFKPSDDRVTFIRTLSDAVDRFVAGQDWFNNAIIVGRNATRVRVNEFFRQRRGFQGPVPDPGDVVMCLKNFRPIFNGMRGIFTQGDYEQGQFGDFEGTVEFPDDNLKIIGAMCSHQFGREKTFATPMEVPGSPNKWRETGMLFDFGYALTCHKAQGSQFRECAVMAGEAFGKSDDRARWLYTAVTRAAERLFLVA